MSKSRHRTNNPEGGPTGPTGPRAGIRGQFTDGPHQEAKARRRGKVGDRRRARRVARSVLKGGPTRPPRQPPLYGVPMSLRRPALTDDERGG